MVRAAHAVISHFSLTCSRTLPWRWRVILGCRAVLLVTSGAPGTAWGRVHVGPVVPCGRCWGPSGVPSALPSGVILSSPAVYAHPAPQASGPPAGASSWDAWAYPPGSSPSLPQGPGGVCPVAPTPPSARRRARRTYRPERCAQRRGTPPPVSAGCCDAASRAVTCARHGGRAKR
jgi:hypothetical protein